jgi:RNA polymerase sigma-70 factor (ECF subfamily)
LSNNANIEDDLTLFALLQQGDNPAFEHIYNKYFSSLFNTAYKRLNDRDMCQDVVQNVFTDLWKRRTELEIRDLQAYLHTAVRFQVLKVIARHSGRTTFVADFDKEIISSLHADEILLDKEARTLVEQFIDALPAKRRAIFIRHYIDELSTAQIALELNVSQKTVQNQLSTASYALRLRLTHLFSLVALLTATMHQP